MVKRTQEPQNRRAGYVVDVPAAAADPTEHRRGHRSDHRHVGKVKVHRGVDDGLERDAARLAREPDRPRAGGTVERARARAVKAAAALPAEGREERLPRIGTTAAAQSLLGNFTLGVSLGWGVNGVEDLGPPRAAARAVVREVPASSGPWFDSRGVRTGAPEGPRVPIRSAQKRRFTRGFLRPEGSERPERLAAPPAHHRQVILRRTPRVLRAFKHAFTNRRRRHGRGPGVVETILGVEPDAAEAVHGGAHEPRRSVSVPRVLPRGRGIETGLDRIRIRRRIRRRRVACTRAF